MKKVIVLTVLFGMITTSAFAAKPTSYDILNNIHGNIRFNVEISVLEGEGEEAILMTKYIPMVINLDGDAVTQDGGSRPVRIIKNIGIVSDVKLEGKVLYDMLPAWAQPALKELYQEAIAEDVSQ